MYITTFTFLIVAFVIYLIQLVQGLPGFGAALDAFSGLGIPSPHNPSESFSNSVPSSNPSIPKPIKLSTVINNRNIYLVNKQEKELKTAKKNLEKRSTSSVSYNGGTVLSGTVNIYYVFYGNWSPGSNEVAMLENLARGYSGSCWYNILTRYYGKNGQGASGNILNSVKFQYSTFFAQSTKYGRSLSDDEITQIILDSINKNSGGVIDPNGVYFLLAGAGITSPGFCTEYCAWHGAAVTNTNQNDYINIAFIGRPPTSCLPGCAAQLISPNGDAGLDSMADTISHELVESATNPSGTGWYNTDTGDENADICSWQYGTVVKTSKGAYYNIEYSGFKYLVQSIWLPFSNGGGVCATCYTRGGYRV